MVQIEKKNQCPSSIEFPEFFKTHPTLICRSIVKASTSLQTKPAMLSDRTCNIVVHKNVEMDQQPTPKVPSNFEINFFK